MLPIENIYILLFIPSRNRRTFIQTNHLRIYSNQSKSRCQVKTQIQAQSAQSIAVGYQHGHTGTLSAFIKLWKQGGMAALYRGWYANIPRLFIGSSTQLTTFGLVSDLLRSWDVSVLLNVRSVDSEVVSCTMTITFLFVRFQILTDYPITLTFVSSLIGGSCVAITMQPFDVLATRLYNQSMRINVCSFVLFTRYG